MKLRKTPFCLLFALLLGVTAFGQTLTDPNLRVDIVVSGLPFATTMTFVGDRDILVLSKQDGRVLRATNGTVNPVAVLDVAVNASSERGMLGIARDPGFEHNRHVWLYYTESLSGTDGGSVIANRVYRYTWTGDALVDPVLVLDLPATPGPNHNAGILAFGNDDRLYTILGDLNRNGQLENFPAGPAPDDTGVVFRTDLHGNALPDNPFYDPLVPDAPLGRYFAYGIRNSFGLGIDPLSGDLWTTENGPSVNDEINRYDPGANSGWERIMGPDALDPDDVGDLWMAPGAFYADPQFTWSSTVAPTTVTFPPSPVIGCDNAYKLFVGDSNCGQIYRFDLNEDRTSLVFTDRALDDRVANNSARCSTELSSVIFGQDFGIVTDIEPGPDGLLYVVSGSRGIIYRIGPQPGAFADQDADGVEDLCDCDDADPAAFGIPGALPRLRMYRTFGATTAQWDSQIPQIGLGLSYRLVSGDLADLRGAGGFGDACTLASGGAATTFDDPRADPLPGAASYYLVRPEGGCGLGSYGDATIDPDPRDVLDASLPAACPVAR